jgi:hypothetical protein
MPARNPHHAGPQTPARRRDAARRRARRAARARRRRRRTETTATATARRGWRRVGRRSRRGTTRRRGSPTRSTRACACSDHARANKRARAHARTHAREYTHAHRTRTHHDDAHARTHIAAATAANTCRPAAAANPESSGRGRSARPVPAGGTGAPASPGFLSGLRPPGQVRAEAVCSTTSPVWAGPVAHAAPGPRLSAGPRIPARHKAQAPPWRPTGPAGRQRAHAGRMPAARGPTLRAGLRPPPPPAPARLPA